MTKRFNTAELVDKKGVRILIDLTQFNHAPEQLYALSCQAQIEYAASRALTEYKTTQTSKGLPHDLEEERSIIDQATQMMSKLINYSI